VTEIDGSFQDAHLPDMPGKWSVQASWNGDEDHNGTESLQVQFIVLSDLLHEVTWNMGAYSIRTLSNSTVSNFVFNGSAIQMGFDVSGLPDTLGFCNVTIPKSLLRDDPWTITIDGTPMTAFVQTENESHTFLYFTCPHTSTLRVTIQGTWIVSEFTSAMVLPLFMVFSLLTVVMMKLKKKK
jgi:hypothetical protein